jgi:hypothetical protein
MALNICLDQTEETIFCLEQITVLVSNFEDEVHSLVSQKYVCKIDVECVYSKL